MYEKLAVKSPCTEDWENMKGNNKTRYCEKCRFNVHDFSQMTQDEINFLLGRGKVCGRLFVRPDGTYLTKDCQKKLSRKKKLKILAWMAAIPAVLLPFINFNKMADSLIIHELRNVPVVGSAVNYIFPLPVAPMPIMMGEICPTPTPGASGENDEDL